MEIRFERVIDLSYPVDEDPPRELPIDPPRIYATATIERDGYFEGRVDLSGHCSTHIDAPALMYADGKTVDQIDPRRLYGRAILMDFSDRLKPGDAITRGMIQKWINRNGDIPEGVILFIRTGMQSYAYQPVFNRRWIGLDGDAAAFLCSKGIKLIGSDSPNIDCVEGKDLDFPAHHTFLKHDIPNVENLTNLDLLPREFFVVVAPMKLAKSSGAPARVFAFI